MDGLINVCLCCGYLTEDAKCANGHCFAFGFSITEDVEPDLCLECEGGGFFMVCYGGPPLERTCENCEGKGYTNE